MKRFLVVITFFFALSAASYANHITGGEMYYTFVSQSGGVFTYHVTLKLFRDHFSSGAQLDPNAAISIFDRVTGVLISNQTVPKSNELQLHLGTPSPCIQNPPVVWYDVGYYEFDISLPGSPNGYIIAYQRCCRIDGISNLGGATSIGSTYTAEIPGNNLLSTAPENSSAKFVGDDTVIVCANNPFSYSFAAQDPDPNDQLIYSFCNAYIGGGPNGPTGTLTSPSPNPAANPPYISVPYSSPFAGTAPLGSSVTLNTSTGLISGIAPTSGIYVVTVCVNEFRGGVLIATQRKDLQIKVGDCTIAKATLTPRAANCKDFATVFENATPSPLINSYFWDFGVTALTNDTSNLPNPTYIYPDTGVYVVKLVTNRNQQCSDSTTTLIRVFPGFKPGFIATGGCFTNPFQFQDTTNPRYGFVNSWRWDFGDLTTTNDVSTIKTPQWTYPTAGVKNVMMIVSSNKGCLDTAQVPITVFDKPIITLAFKDTLICRPDIVKLIASGTGTFSWSPLTNIINNNTPTPTVNPTTTTWYKVKLDDNGCINNDSVHVRVVDFVTLNAMGDTTICRTDSVQLTAVTDGLQFTWSPSATISNPNILSPYAKPVLASTPYTILARIGSCTATDDVTITTVPYPGANAGKDPTICYNTSAQLNASIVGVRFTWTPASYLNDPLILNPVSSPPRTTQYILSAYDVLGCPKPGRDTVLVTVLPRVRAFAGRDTTVVVGQPLQFTGTGGVNYVWTPSTGLSSTTIFNPIGTYTANIDSVKYKLVVTDAAGCADSAFVKVTVFKTIPYVFVPTAFTPNGDGLNDDVRPIAVGISKINYFSVYNRWGQLVFTTTINGKGWDGRIKGVLQSTNVFVWMVNAVDYTGKPLFLKGTVTLIR